MSLDKPYLDVPGTTIFDAEQSRKGYWLNQFCMSLMKAENRARFKANERGYLDEWAMTEEEYRDMMMSGGRSVEGNRFVGEDGDAQAQHQPQGAAGRSEGKAGKKGG